MHRSSTSARTPAYSLSGPVVLAAVLVHGICHARRSEAAGRESAESAIPGINDQLAELATMGLTSFQVEGPGIYCGPAGPSSAYGDSFVVYQAAIIQPGGVGAVLWDAAEYEEYTSPPHGEPVDLADNFIRYEKCPPIVRALLVAHAGRLVERFMGDVRLISS